ncbi:hypothetical protein T552_01826 [Pneumocystis carinii B80]|uniref:Translation elongation factor EF1B beta/delta subunit guanine nucleotide exchange domain-containing protein n=1 Tax=Pneumocystis carinii (strain B80) TaxID=1408658 RepID=A0A0W4ZJR3_PNEC8|nr:hypothetical protein T552_01826 [Pneumocystis carinii B80]KTW28565.1 hypothetical protein T552_01826 [Pneumocystis carinii B80]
MASFDLVSESSLSLLNNFFEDKSYVVGYTPSQADVSLFHEIKQLPSAEKYPNLTRWYTHICSYTQDFEKFPGEKGKPASSYLTDIFICESKKEEDDDIDLFASDDSSEAERIREERLAMYKEKKASKPKVIAKSIVTMDVKPWDDETDMVALEEGVRAIEMDGLVWGSGKLVLVGYGIRKLQITLVVEDEKVSIEELQERIAELEDYVQSSDVVAMQKL